MKSIESKVISDFNIHGIRLTVRANDKGIRAAIGGYLNRFRPFDAPLDQAKQISFDLYCSRDFLQGPSIPATAVLISSPELELKAYKTGNELYFVLEGSWLRLSLREYNGIGVFDDSIWTYPTFILFAFFLNGLFVSLHGHELYKLHGAGLVREGKGYFFVGKSGSGKSTIALTLVTQGWHYLGDDILMLRQINSNVEGLAIPIEFKVDDRIFRKFFAGSKDDFVFTLPKYDKKFLKIDRLYPDQFEARCMPRFLMFPEITSLTKSKLVPLKKSETLKRLIDSSRFFLLNSDQTGRHLNTLSALVKQTTSYRLFVGNDLLEEPKSFERLLLEGRQVDF